MNKAGVVGGGDAAEQECFVECLLRSSLMESSMRIQWALVVSIQYFYAEVVFQTLQEYMALSQFQSLNPEVERALEQKTQILSWISHWAQMVIMIYLFPDFIAT